MSKLVIPCPKCGAGLKLPGRELLGKKAKCPKCAHRFILQEPDEVVLELAEPATPEPPTPAASDIPVGTGARWIPDSGPATVAMDFPPLPDPASQVPPPAVQQQPQAPAPPQADAGSFAPAIQVENESPMSRVGGRKRRKKKKKKGSWVVPVVVLTILGAAGGFYFAKQRENEVVVQQDPNNAPAENNAEWDAEVEQLTAAAESLKEESPTNGDPIPMLNVPDGTRILLHLHPERLWSSKSRYQEFVACLGPVAERIRGSIEEYSGFAPADIDEMTFCIIPGSRGMVPDIATVTRLKAPQKRSEFIKRLRATRSENYAEPVFLSATRAFVIVDEQTLASAPVALIDQVLQTKEQPGIVPSDIESLLPRTDRDRDVTVVFEPEMLEVHEQHLADPIAHPLIHQLVDWFGKSSASAVFSFHLGSKFYSELLVKNGMAADATLSSSPARMNRYLRTKMEQLPRSVLAAVEKMEPQQYGYRRIIGRFPAMTKVFSLSTRSGIGDDFVRLTTLLPERAAPNLALGALLTWDESTRTDFDRVIETPKAKVLPNTLAERLKLKVDFDFNGVPFQEIFDIMGQEVGIEFQIDGPGLKAVAYTKNMRDSEGLSLGEISVEKGLAAVVGKFEKIAFVADPDKKIILVTTKDFAANAGQTTMELNLN